MSPHVRNTLALAGVLVAYGIVLWLYESKGVSTWAKSYATSPRALWARQNRNSAIQSEFLTITTTEEPSS